MNLMSITSKAPMPSRHHVALHLAHRWFAFLEAAGGDLATHLAIFNPQVRLTGSLARHLFANDHASLKAWFAAVPDEVSSHHILHSTYSTTNEGRVDGHGLLDMVIAYQSPAGSSMHGSIISYQTRVEFTPEGARFIALDKTPILGNTRADYQTSWATNRVLALVHAALGGIKGSDGRLSTALGDNVHHVAACATALEASSRYDAVVTCSGGNPAEIRVLHLMLKDDGKSGMPQIEAISPLTTAASNLPPRPFVVAPYDH